jgi:hypothetical protein
MASEGAVEPAVGRCDACASTHGPLVKLSLGRDFFGRAYDRLSPSSDQSPKWYCEACSMQKNLQRDYRDIQLEFEKLTAGQASELSTPAQLQRAHLRLMEISALLAGPAPGTRLLQPHEVNDLLFRIQARPGLSSVSR